MTSEFEAKLAGAQGTGDPTTLTRKRRGDLVPEGRSRCSAPTSGRPLGNELLVMFEELMQGAPSQNVPHETDAAAELPRAR